MTQAYKRKPLTVIAMQVPKPLHMSIQQEGFGEWAVEVDRFFRWLGGYLSQVRTSELTVRSDLTHDDHEVAFYNARPGQWILRDPDGELAVMSDEDFKSAFEPVP